MNHPRSDSRPQGPWTTYYVVSKNQYRREASKRSRAIDTHDADITQQVSESLDAVQS